MAAPQVVNRRPDEGDVSVSTITPFRFGVRDADTRADLRSVHCSVTYARAVYIPDTVLPEVDSTLKAAGASLSLAMFDDASGTTDPGDPCDRTIESVGDAKVLRIEKSDGDGVRQEGMTYISVPAQEDPQPYLFRATISPEFVTASSYDYVTHEDFVGVVVGFVYWPENTGVFLLLRGYEGGTRTVSVVGPSIDGIGTRPIDVEVEFDWGREVEYSIHVDPTIFRRKVTVYATPAGGDEVLLAEVDMDGLNEFLPSVRMGRLCAEDAPTDLVTAVVGLDGTEQGNYVDVGSFALHSYGRVLAVSGGSTNSGAVTAAPTELIEVVGSQGAAEWRSSGAPDEELMPEALRLSATAGPAIRTRTEPDLARGEWMLFARFVGISDSHEGSYRTGLGFRVEDGTRQIELSLLSDFSSNTIGIPNSGADEDPALTGFFLPDSAVDWSDEVSALLLASASRDAVRFFVGEECTDPVIDEAYADPGYPASSDSAVSFGVVGSGGFSGSLYLVHLQLFPSCTFYEGSEASYPDAQGWLRSQSGAVRYLEGSGVVVECTVPGAHDIYYLEDETYDAESGAAVMIRADIWGWTDSDSAVNPPRKEFGPIALVRTSTVAAQLRFVLGDGGELYAFLSHDEADYLDVLAQNEAGRALSVRVDLGVPHTYLLDVKPLQYLRLYVDFSATPSIEMAWPFSGGLREMPPEVPETAVVAFGSLGESAGVEMHVSYARASVGRGYDLKILQNLSDGDLQDHVYGSAASLLVDVQDED